MYGRMRASGCAAEQQPLICSCGRRLEQPFSGGSAPPAPPRLSPDCLAPRFPPRPARAQPCVPCASVCALCSARRGPCHAGKGSRPGRSARTRSGVRREAPLRAHRSLQGLHGRGRPAARARRTSLLRLCSAPPRCTRLSVSGRQRPPRRTQPVSQWAGPPYKRARAPESCAPHLRSSLLCCSSSSERNMQWFMRWHVHAHAAAGPPSLCPRSTHASGGVAACSLGGGPRAVAGGRLCVERRVLSAQLRAQRGGARARRGARGGRAGRAERRRRGGRRHQGGCVRACVQGRGSCREGAR